ncbi:MIP family channel protein [Kocuria sediminis]|uniref:MIP family channel protein n=1 Tax=Kocuria sediminis TaxID=1038857 RepID=A0A6N8GHR3_9MICC|nr:aquaporin [Kocuria sediminis]MUN61787.1 MIP family channel protein [Kocuria sediminis]
MTENVRTSAVRPGAEEPAHGSTGASTGTLPGSRPGAGPEDRADAAVLAGRRDSEPTGLAAPVPAAARKDPAPATGQDDPSAPARWAAEFAGTALLVFAGLGTGMFATEVIDSALGFGLGLLAAVVAFGHVSGGHFNPAVTLAAVVAGRTAPGSAIGYVVAQVLGALTAAGVLWAVLMTLLDSATTAQVIGGISNGFGANSASQAGWTTVLLVEFVATALLALVVLGSTAPRANAVLAPVAMAAALAFLLTVTAPFDGGSLNPARSTGAAVVAGSSHLGQLWLFWVAPLLGGLVAGLAHRAAGLRRPRAGTAADTAAHAGTVHAGTVHDDTVQDGTVQDPSADPARRGAHRDPSA